MGTPAVGRQQPHYPCTGAGLPPCSTYGSRVHSGGGRACRYRAVAAARQRALDRCGVPPPAADAGYWQVVFEATAAEVLAVLPAVHMTPGFVVRYRFFGQRGGDLLVRPFVARPTTEVETILELLDWHPAPDSVASSEAHRPTQDVALLYRHFSYDPSALGVFEYWLAMQELWASQRWAHSHLIASAAELSQITARPGGKSSTRSRPTSPLSCAATARRGSPCSSSVRCAASRSGWTRSRSAPISRCATTSRYSLRPVRAATCERR